MERPIRVATNNNPKFTQKKVDLCSYPYHIPASTPDSLFPIAVERKKPPIIRAVIREGESFETNESPIGDRQSSPTVITP